MFQMDQREQNITIVPAYRRLLKALFWPGRPKKPRGMTICGFPLAGLDLPKAESEDKWAA